MSEKEMNAYRFSSGEEPSDEMLEVGIAALQAVLPEQEGEDRW